MSAFDYIIVGAGSAGAVLANRLTQDGTTTVLLLEAGGSDRSFWLQVPIGYGKVYYDQRVNWKYTTEPDANLNGQRMYWPRGKVLGGSSSINAMVYVRGHHKDFDDWGAIALGWSWRDVAPVFKRMESWDHGEDEWRGGDGPLSVHDMSDEAHPLSLTYLKAAEQAGFPLNRDYNGADMEGAALYQITTQDGRRASSSQAYLRPAMSRKNLRVLTKAMVHKVLFEDGRAVGVRYQRGGRIENAMARGEVILCAGAINSPQLLQLSGIGPGDVLQDAGVDTISHSAPVGCNLRDHLGMDNMYRANVPSLNQDLRPLLGKLRVGLQYILTRKGPLSLSLNQGGGFIRMRDDADRPDMQLYFSPLSYTRAPVGKRPLMSPDGFPGFLLGFNPCRPTSTGSLRIRSADPYEAPEMHGNYMSTDNDRQLMIDGVRLMRKIAQSPALDAVIEEELSPGPAIESDEQIADIVRKKSWTVFHQCGTCAMGQDPATSVVDARLRVHGIKGLRVADASIFPTIPSGNTNAPAIMVGEKASDIILEDRRKRSG